MLPNKLLAIWNYWLKKVRFQKVGSKQLQTRSRKYVEISSLWISSVRLTSKFEVIWKWILISCPINFKNIRQKFRNLMYWLINRISRPSLKYKVPWNLKLLTKLIKFRLKMIFTNPNGFHRENIWADFRKVSFRL